MTTTTRNPIPPLVRLWTEAAATLTTEIRRAQKGAGLPRYLVCYGVLRERIRAAGAVTHSPGVLRRAWYRLFGLPELRAQVWLYPRVPLRRRLRGDRERVVSTVELPADLTQHERRRLVANLREIADHMAGDERP